MTEASYRRAQVEWALWQVFRKSRPGRDDVPPAFKNRIKKLLDGDRSSGVLEGSDPDAAPFAFAEDPTEGTGADAAFTAFDGACLAYALDLVDAGFKPKETIFLLRHIRGTLHDEIDDMVETGAFPQRARMHPKDYPTLPTYRDAKGFEWADARIFLVTRKVDVSEVYAEQINQGPLFLAPKFCWGIEALKEELHRFGHDNRKAFVLEIAWSAYLMASFLEQAPIVTRGVKG